MNLEHAQNLRDFIFGPALSVPGLNIELRRQTQAAGQYLPSATWDLA